MFPTYIANYDIAYLQLTITITLVLTTNPVSIRYKIGII